MITYDQDHTTTGTIELGDACPGSVSRWLVTITDEGSLSGLSIAPRGTAAGGGKTPIDVGYVNCTDPTTNIDGSSTEITAAGNYLIEASGMEIDLVITAISAGTVGIQAVPLRG